MVRSMLLLKSIILYAFSVYTVRSFNGVPYAHRTHVISGGTLPPVDPEAETLSLGILDPELLPRFLGQLQLHRVAGLVAQFLNRGHRRIDSGGLFLKSVINGNEALALFFRIWA